jgi:hypothetical protein
MSNPIEADVFVLGKLSTEEAFTVSVDYSTQIAGLLEADGYLLGLLGLVDVGFIATIDVTSVGVVTLLSTEDGLVIMTEDGVAILSI